MHIPRIGQQVFSVLREYAKKNISVVGENGDKM
jgi:hypothetical protein